MENYFELLRRHGLTLWLGNIVGSLVAGVIFAVMTIIIALIGLLLLVLIAGGMIGSIMDPFNPESPDPFAAAMDKAAVPVLIGLLIFSIFFILAFFLYSGFSSAGMNSMVNHAVFEDRSSLQIYFTQGLRFMWKMAGQQFLLFLFFIPSIVLFALGIVIFAAGLMEGNESLLLVSSLPLLVATILTIVLALVFLHAPVILVAENTGIWKAIALSGRLFTRSFGQVFLSGLIIFLINFAYGLFLILLSEFFGFNSFDPASSAELNPGLQFLFSLIQYALGALVNVLWLLAVFVRYRNRLRPRLFPDENSGTIGGMKTIWG